MLKMKPVRIRTLILYNDLFWTQFFGITILMALSTKPTKDEKDNKTNESIALNIFGHHPDICEL